MKVLALFLGVSLVAAADGPIVAPHIVTDRGDYVDGETVEVRGYGFRPLEVVSLQITSPEGDVGVSPVRASWSTFAEADGAINAAWRLDPDRQDGPDLIVTAKGDSSGASAQFVFRHTTPPATLKRTSEPAQLQKTSPFDASADDIGLMASTAMLAGSFNIDGNVPDASALAFPDPYGSVSELGPVNTSSTKLLAISSATAPILGFTNPNAQVDLRSIWMATSVVNGDAWLYFAWERDSNGGSGAIAFEFQQAPRPAACDYGKTDQVDTPANSPAGEAQLIAACNPWANRRPGDFLIVWDQGGKAINIIKRTFYLDSGTGQLALDAGVILSAADSAAAVSADRFRGEGAINLSRTVFPANPTSCFSIANIIPGTVTGNSDSADYKDTLLAEFAARVAVSNCGQLKVTKVTQPAGGTGSFPYTIARTNAQPLRFPADGGQTTLADTLVQDGDFDVQFKLIAASNYRLTEGSVGPTWATQSIVCGGTDVTSGGTFTLQPSLVTECTITNRLEPGTLIVKKVVTNDDGGALTCADFSFSVNGGAATAFDADCQNEVTVDATGTYTVTEPSVAGYSISTSGCTSVQVPAGGSATCTVTNDDKAARLRLVKSVTNDNGGTSVPAAWQLSASGTGGFTDAGNSTTFHQVRAAQAHSLSESSVLGYDFVSWSCNAGTFVSPNTITLGLDQQATCTVTNDDRKATPGVTTVERAVLHDAATVSGIRPGAPAPAATVTFRLYSDAACGTQVGSDETVPVAAAGTASTVNGVLVTAPGTYYWRAVYSGDAFNVGFTTACGSERTTLAF